MVKLRRMTLEGGACRQVLKYGARRPDRPGGPDGPDEQLARNAFESERMHTVSSGARKERADETKYWYNIYYRWMLEALAGPSAVPQP